MESILLLVNSAPASPSAQRAWQMAQTLYGQGHPVTLFLLQDGVLAGLKGNPSLRDLPPEIRCHALGEDLALHGFAPSNLRKHVKVADYGKLVDLFGEHARVIGAL